MKIIGEVRRDGEPPNTPFHKAIVKMKRILGTRFGVWCDLSCGHTVAVFGDAGRANGVVFCMQCSEEKSAKAGGN